jgi:hypothetical protein
MEAFPLKQDKRAEGNRLFYHVAAILVFCCNKFGFIKGLYPKIGVRQNLYSFVFNY